MKKIFILGTLLTATTAVHADIPTMQYLYEFYERECGWPAEMGLPDMIEEFLQEATGQTIPKSAIATQWVSLAFVDSFNGNTTTYAQDLVSNNVISVGFLGSTLDLINNPMCCVNGALNMRTLECEYCDANLFAAKDEPCPRDWERVELSHAEIAFSTDDEWSPENLSFYYTYSPICAMQIVSAPPASVPVDACLPPVNGEIATVQTYAEGNYMTWHDFVIGDGCTVSGTEITCDVTRIKGFAQCHSDGGCGCRKEKILSTTGILVEQRGISLTPKDYADLNDCAANCPYDCADAIQNVPGFRHTFLMSGLTECGT